MNNRIIVFNALQTSLSGGIGRYSYELSKQIYLENRYIIKIVIRKEDIKLFSFADKKDLIIVSGINNSRDRNIYEQFKLPRLIYKMYPKAIIHYPDSMAPIFSRNKVVITIHDLAFKSLKNVFTWKTVLWKNIITNISIRKSSKIISITNFTKNEILTYYPNLNTQKISVVHNGFNDFSKEMIEEDNVRKEIKSLNDYILTVSTISPRKNVDGLIKAFSRIKDDIKADLVIAGDNGWMYDKIYELVEELNISNRVKFTGKVNDDELKFLYKNAKVFTYLSFYEGFGLPPLEAMSYGIPCVVSNTSSLPEVVGKLADKVNPRNDEEIAYEILKLYKGKFNQNTFNNINEIYSWEKCAKELLEVYKEI